MTSLPAAIKHLRTRTGCSLLEGKRLAEQIADERPGSDLALARATWDKEGRRFKWASLAFTVGLMFAAFVIEHWPV